LFFIRQKRIFREKAGIKRPSSSREGFLSVSDHLMNTGLLFLFNGFPPYEKQVTLSKAKPIT
jgi:hypothetical protein